ncbi:MAG TPA: 5-formyltetrahydrofolate cyclo-ligase [Stellaceae bacterium]|nr:5-formyltetrahydrofolate cyclo-ligase [Stellaceae bacterium]
MTKQQLRRLALARREAAAARIGAEAALAVRDTLLGMAFPEGAVIAGYWPIRHELDPRPALTALAERGFRLALPAVTERGAALQFRCWQPGDALFPDMIKVPAPSPEAPLVPSPSILLVPLLAFDRWGGRLGFGGGYYDRTLASTRGLGKVLALGLAFADQEVERVPLDPNDQCLDGVVSEHGLRWSESE